MKVFPAPKFVKAKFEDFQKSEMIKIESIDEDNTKCTLIFVQRGLTCIMLKQERKLIK